MRAALDAMVEASTVLDEVLASDPRGACPVLRTWVGIASPWVVQCEKISP
jgi:hypothetical protein